MPYSRDFTLQKYLPVLHGESLRASQELRGKPIDIAGGDEDLVMIGDGLQQVTAPPGIELREHVVQEQDRPLTRLCQHELKLSQLER